MNDAILKINKVKLSIIHILLIAKKNVLDRCKV